MTKDLISYVEGIVGEFNERFRYCNGRPMEGSLELTHNNVRDFLPSLISTLLDTIIQDIKSQIILEKY